MLDELIVTNLGLIEEAHLEPGPGLVVVTGETGAGKTLLLGALRLLAGGQARRDLVGPAGDEASVQARFRTEEGETTVVRRITTTGRSRTYVDGMVTPVKAVEEATAGAVEIVSQHDHLRLTRSAHLRQMLDGALDEEGRNAAEAYAAAWEALAEVTAKRNTLGGDRRALERELATVRHQAAEIAAAGFSTGDDADLEATLSRLRHAREIVDGLQAASAALGEEGAEGPLDTAVIALERVAALDPTLAGLAAQASDLASLASELRGEAAATADMDLDPAQLESLEQRMALLGDLRRRYGATLDEVLAFGDEATRRSADLTQLLAEADTIDKEHRRAEEEVHAAAATLSAARRRAADVLTRCSVEHLTDLGFSSPVVGFAFAARPPGAAGADGIELRFASDSSLEPGPVGRTASGGELSRLVLALRLASGAADATVAAFDEIDAGVGGAVALALGRKLAGLARSCQVLCVTHLPQVAAHADTHYVVDRRGNVTTVRQATGEERLEELSRMLAGMPGSERGKQHAAELLALAARGGT